ncbi:MAG TPA: 23S rRNA (guanosine(2251)-2'-O)-methyltransferase RlmB [Pyrinomonadaceae bacterium]|jgi:23S rRNA (guanosine2251-2'-O)-methyltransferase|nr:23S rRNA (guanosine(2251)-2'-O)-methyltransferase RlmB [Pyrinomonadaceae bacterium]
MKKTSRRATANRHLLYGVNPVLEALRAERVPDQITIAASSRDERLRELIDIARRRGVVINQARRIDLDREVGNRHHQGVIARIAGPEYADSDGLLSSIAARVGQRPEPLVLVLDGIEDPRNLGAILRTAECAGSAGAFIPERRAAGLNETVAKASAGAIEYLPVARVTNLSVLIRQLKERNVWVVGTAADGELNYFDWDWTRPSAVVMGAEGAGLHRLVRENCDALVRIPVHGKIESLNVSVAAGIILYEALRQRSHIQSEPARRIRR